MKTLWFRGCFRAAILRGEKTDTIRMTCRLREGEHVALSVGPRPAFARARVTRITRVTLADLCAERRAQVLACYPDLGPAALVWRIEFELVENVPADDPALAPAGAQA